MKEPTLRKWHRWIGIIIVPFLLLQGGTGFLISLSSMVGSTKSHAHTNKPEKSFNQKEAADTEGSHDLDEEGAAGHGVLAFIHHNEGFFWDFYRVLLGLGVIWMVISGSILFFRVLVRSSGKH